MSRIGFFTFGVLKADFGDPAVQGFVDRIADVFDTAEGSGGFIDHASTGGLDWGERVSPRFADGALNRVTSTLSIWQDVESVSIFAILGVHSEALRRRHEWYPDVDYPNHVGWWIDDDHVPTWAEASERIEYLHDNGSTPRAFSLRSAHDTEGEPMKADPGTMNQYQKRSRR
jgi:hypothetical protein